MASIPFTLVANVTMLTLRLTFQAKKFSIVSALGVAFLAVSSIIFVVVLGMGVKGIFIANLLAGVFRMVIGLAITYRYFKPALSRRWLVPMLLFGIPLLPASLSIWILNYSSRYFLVRLATLEDIGLLSVGGKIASLVTFIITAFQIGWGPFAYSIMKDTDLAKRTYSVVLTYFMMLTFVFTVRLSIFAREAVLILATPVYEPSTVLVPWLSFASIAWGMVYIVGMGYNIAKKSYHTTISTVLGAGLTFGLNFALIPVWGILGAAVATMIGNVATLIYSYFLGQRYFSVTYEYRRIFTLI
jgi:O-antigen/teichoic acid export membrane protein